MIVIIAMLPLFTQLGFLVAGLQFYPVSWRK